MSRRHAVDGVGVIGNLDSPARQLIAKAYRPGARGPRGNRQGAEALAEVLGGEDEGLPETLAAFPVKRGKDLSAARVEDRQASGALFPRHGWERRTGAGLFGDSAAESVQSAHPDGRDTGTGSKPARGREADADADERARPAPDRESAHLAPTAAGLDRPLDLSQQGGRVPGAALRRGPERLLMQDRGAARRADGGIDGRRVEADDRLLLGAQVSR